MTDKTPQALPSIPPIHPKSQNANWFLPSLVGFILASLLAGVAFFYQTQNKPKVETISRESVISRIQTLNRLQTVGFNIDTVIQSHKDGSWQKLWTDEQKGLFVAHGRVQAGIDLNQLKPENVQVMPPVQGNTTMKQQVAITLPPAQVFETYLDNIEVYDIKTGLFGAMPTDPQIFEQAQSVGKQQVLATACKADILNLATDNAQKQVQSLFTLADMNVTVTTSPINECK